MKIPHPQQKHILPHSPPPPKMAGPSSSLKTLNSIAPLPTAKPSSPSSSLSSMKLKALLQTFIFSHMYRFVRALNKAKVLLLHLFKDIHFIDLLQLRKLGRKHKQKKLIFGSFRLYYNWCSSHAMPVVEGCSNSNVCCDYSSTWSSVISKRFDYDGFQECSSELSRYLQWLEEKGHEEDIDSSCCNEIDRLADLFIANCHEKFRLEKQESYRMFQEMMARSV